MQYKKSNHREVRINSHSSNIVFRGSATSIFEMFVKVSWITITIIVLFCVYTFAQEISQKCIGCICEAASGCNVTVGCDGPVCGPFYITKQYWIDAGKPYINGGQSDNDNEDTFRSCAKDAYCAARTVENYMAKFSRDCTGNGIINCDDYIRIHRFGASGCTNTLHSVYENIYKLCIQTVGEY